MEYTENVREGKMKLNNHILFHPQPPKDTYMVCSDWSGKHLTTRKRQAKYCRVFKHRHKVKTLVSEKRGLNGGLMSCYSSNMGLVRGFSNKWTMECKHFFEQQSRCFQTRLRSRTGFDYQRPAEPSTGFHTNTSSTSTVCRKPLVKVIFWVWAMWALKSNCELS